MHRYHNDQPITGVEDEPDQLNRERFAQHLADILILEPEDECLTISLEGEWGYGKSSVINLIKKASLKHENQPIMIDYNPWLAGKAEALIQDFLIQFSSQLAIAQKPEQGLQAAKELLAYSQLFNAMKFMPGVEPWASTMQGVYGSIGDASKKITKLKEVDVLERKKKVRQTLQGLAQPIVVVIDDIDRLTPDEAFQIIRLVKAVADFPGTSFLLAFDPEYLAGSLKSYGIKKAEQYIDKVVQLRVPLPVIATKDMQKLANLELASLSDYSLTDVFAEDQKRLSYIYHKHLKYLVRSPRELKHIFNHLRFVLAQIEGEVCFTDLYCLSVLAIKAQNIYQSLKDSPEMYVGRKFDESVVFEKREVIVKRYQTIRETILAQYEPRNREHIQRIVCALFPLTEHSDGVTYDPDYDRCGRVASEKRLYIALHYQIPSGFASDTDIIAFINGETNRKVYLKRAIEESFVERLFELLQHNVDKVKASNALDMLHAIYDVFLESDYLASFVDVDLGPFDFDPFHHISWLSIGLIAKQDHKKDVLFSLVRQPEYLAVTADLIRRLMIQNDAIPTNDPSLKKDVWLYGKDYSQILEIWCQLTLKQLEHSQLSESIHAKHIYAVLVQAAPEQVQLLFSKVDQLPPSLQQFYLELSAKVEES